MAPGQSLVLEWAGPYFTWSSQPQQVIAPGLLQIQVPRLEIIDAIGRSVQVRYSVNGTLFSPVFVLNIDSQGIEMPPLRYINQGGGNHVVSILSPGQQIGHTGRVRWNGVVVRDSDEQHLEAGKVEYFQIPQFWITENQGREVLINYTLYRGNNEPFRFSRVLRQRF